MKYEVEHSVVKMKIKREPSREGWGQNVMDTHAHTTHTLLNTHIQHTHTSIPVF